MKRAGICTIIILTLLCLGLSQAQLKEETGAFKLYKNETQIGRITYSIDNQGVYRRSFLITLAGQSVRNNLTLHLDADGSWHSGLLQTPTDTIAVERQDSLAVYTVRGKEYRITFDPGCSLYDNYGPYFESLFIKRYDHKAGGKQNFRRFIFPSMMSDFSLEYKGTRIAAVGEDKIKFSLYDMTVMGIVVHIWADHTSRVCMMDVPVQYAVFVREGFEDLLGARMEDLSVSQPKFEVSVEKVMIPMRDGVHLAADVYHPSPDTAKCPVILIRTPYKKEMQQLDGEYWARRGYVCVIQDCRGRFSSEGSWEPFLNEAEDGYDTIEWLAGQPWSSGKVGMIGGSYVGWVQLWAAAQMPPHLTTIIPQVAPPDPFYNIPYEYGAFFLLGSLWWAEVLESKATGDLSGRTLSEINQQDYEKVLKSLPVIDLDKKVLGGENPYWRAWIKNYINGSYWQRANFMEKLKQVTIPVFLQSGWFDGDGIGTKLNYLALKKSGNKNLKMIVGPWGHTNQSTTVLGTKVLGSEAALDLQIRFLKWFDYWLKGKKNGIMEEPQVMLYDMFSNRWLTGDSYPLPETDFTDVFLSSREGANTSRGDGTLLWSAPAEGKEFDQYSYDPGDPTPSPEYYFESKDEIEKDKAEGVNQDELMQRRIAFHNRVTDERRDILVFQTSPLDSSLTVAGPVAAFLYASSDARDTDWFVSLTDVDEKGEVFQLVKGVARARFREGTDREVFLEKGRIYQYRIDMWHTGITFKKGHRIRVEISSALFPLFSRNLNTGGHNETETGYVTARQRIYHSKKYPSRVSLPIIH